jgi:hypothetical protein
MLASSKYPDRKFVVAKNHKYTNEPGLDFAEKSRQLI